MAEDAGLTRESVRETEERREFADRLREGEN
jgi:hypothetical protein